MSCIVSQKTATYCISVPLFVHFLSLYKDAKFFFNFSFSHFYITHMDIFRQSFLSNNLIDNYEILCTPSGRQSLLCK